MAINFRCPNCRRTTPLTTELCPCGNDLTKNRKFKVNVRFPNGQRRTKTVPDLKTAQKVEAKFKVQAIEHDVFNIKKFPTMKEVYDQYIKWAEHHKRSWKSDKERWHNHIAKHLSSKRMDRVTPSNVQKVIDEMRSRKTRRGVPYAHSTVRQVLTLMKRLYNWSIKMGLCPEIVNPCNRIEFPKFDNTVTNPFSKKDLKILMDTLTVFGNERASLVILFALYTGKRLGEILSLTWSDVSIERGLVTLRGTNTKNKRTQTIPVNQKTLVVLKRCRQLKAGEYVFPCSTGKFFHNFGVVWQRIRRKAKLEGYRFHDLRHTYASYLISSGEVDIYTMQKLLGHQTITMTQRYAHLAPDTLRKATNVADEVFQDL